MPYIDIQQSLELSTLGKLYCKFVLVDHYCRHCKCRFSNSCHTSIKSRYCVDCRFNLYADNRSLDEF